MEEDNEGKLDNTKDTSRNITDAQMNSVSDTNVATIEKKEVEPTDYIDTIESLDNIIEDSIKNFSQEVQVDERIDDLEGKEESQLKEESKLKNDEHETNVDTDDIRPSTKQLQIKEKKERHKVNKGTKVLIVLLIVIILVVMSVIFAVININNKNVISGVAINGIDVAGYSKEELLNKIIEYSNKNEEKIIELIYGEQENDITPQTVNTTYNIDEIVNKAYCYGREDNILVNNFKIAKALIFKQNFELIAVPDEKLLTKEIESFNKSLDGVVQEASYYIENDKLYVTRGKDGISIKEDELKEKIIQEINNFQKGAVVIDVPVCEAKAKAIDMDKIHQEIYREPQDAYVSTEPLEVHPDIDGIDLAVTIEEAKELIKEDKEEYEIPLKITSASKTLAQLGEEAFPHELGTFSTNFNVAEASRSTNIRLATEKVNGVVVLPGETFSYNTTVGRRTAEAGFKAAGAYSGGKVVQEIGGGICQVSSTLYNAVLYANLEIVERYNHCFESSYVAESRDATVSWGGPDFKFKNTRKYPIKIVASSTNGIEVVSIYGLREEVEYEVEIRSRRLSTIGRKTEYVNDASLAAGEEVVIQSGHDGCTSEAYRILKKDGQEISSTLLSRDTYIALSKIVKRGTYIYSQPEAEIVETESTPQ